MEQIIADMIETAVRENYIEIFDSIRELIRTFATTFNAPSNWRDIGEMLAEKYKDNKIVYNELQLWDYE